MTNQQSDSKKLVALTLEKLMKVLKALNQKRTQFEFGVDQSAIARIESNLVKITAEYTSCNVNLKRKRAREPEAPDVDEAVLRPLSFNRATKV